jgi:hypothetical protein
MPKLTQGKVTQSQSPKVEPVTHKANPGGVAQQGSATAFKKEVATMLRRRDPVAVEPFTGRVRKVQPRPLSRCRREETPSQNTARKSVDQGGGGNGQI